jgi:hypothetical protein
LDWYRLSWLSRYERNHRTGLYNGLLSVCSEQKCTLALENTVLFSAKTLTKTSLLIGDGISTILEKEVLVTVTLEMNQLNSDNEIARWDEPVGSGCSTDIRYVLMTTDGRTTGYGWCTAKVRGTIERFFCAVGCSSGRGAGTTLLL